MRQFVRKHKDIFDKYEEILEMDPEKLAEMDEVDLTQAQLEGELNMRFRFACLLMTFFYGTPEISRLPFAYLFPFYLIVSQCSMITAWRGKNWGPKFICTVSLTSLGAMLLELCVPRFQSLVTGVVPWPALLIFRSVRVANRVEVQQ